MMMSRTLQAHFKSLLLSTYFQDVTKLRQNETAAALLAWAAFPISTSISFANDEIKKLNTDKDVFWNWPDKDLRRAMVFDSHTKNSLAAALAVARERLLDAGDGHNAGFFAPSELGDFLNLATNQMGDTLLQSLLITEMELVRGAAGALKDVQQSLNDMPTAPTKAIVSLAEFGAKITDTFNNKLSIYGNEALRPLSSMLLLAASGALSPGAMAAPRAMLNLYVLNSQHAFDLSQFLAGDLPAQSDVAVAQTLTNLGLNP